MKRILVILTILTSSKMIAQQDFILYHMPSIPQITQVDPASFPDSKPVSYTHLRAHETV